MNQSLRIAFSNELRLSLRAPSFSSTLEKTMQLSNGEKNIRNKKALGSRAVWTTPSPRDRLASVVHGDNEGK